MIAFDEKTCRDLKEASSREWLETNGLGGFAGSTISGMNTRRYHGLLTAATQPPVGRMLLLSKLEGTLVVGDERIDLATNEYAGAVHPNGYQHLVAFRLDPFPVFTYEAGGVRLEKTVFMVHGSNTTVVTYSVEKAPARMPVRLEVRPLIAFRDYHSTTHENGAIDGSFQREPNLVSLQPYQGVPRLYLGHNAAAVEAQGFWYHGFSYAIERERGLDHLEDLYNPLVMTFELGRGKTAVVVASTEKVDHRKASTWERSERKRRASIASVKADDEFARSLAVAADQFLVKRGNGSTVIAGYPWFTDWGRDTMIALPGLTLFTGRADVAKAILREFAQHVDRGMLPNRFPDDNEAPEFNTVDATLWFFEAVRAYAAEAGDHKFVRELYPVLADIVDWHIKGTRYGIHMLDNGLLNAGEAGVQLTWMDAKIDEWVVTPRSGKPVEIQALWYNALKVMEELAARFGDPEGQKRYRTVSSLLHWSFNRVFWNEKEGCLYDVVNGVPDGSIRPNQVIALSLHHSMVPADRARSVLAVVERELLTPMGLRTLSPRDPRYRGRYQGDARSRDSVYHQGTVWPWLLGPFVSAYVKVNGGGAATRQRAMEFLRPLQAHLEEAGLGQISEIFDADAPHTPRGCFAQAWSVAEVLRALCQDVCQVRPKAAEAAAAVTPLKAGA